MHYGDISGCMSQWVDRHMVISPGGEESSFSMLFHPKNVFLHHFYPFSKISCSRAKVAICIQPTFLKETGIKIENGTNYGKKRHSGNCEGERCWRRVYQATFRKVPLVYHFSEVRGQLSNDI